MVGCFPGHGWQQFGRVRTSLVAPCRGRNSAVARTRPGRCCAPPGRCVGPRMPPRTSPLPANRTTTITAA